jgi:hypothetical protein
MTDKTDAEFEAWWIKQPFHEQFEDVKDQMRNVAVAFYQKGREDVVIELDTAYRTDEDGYWVLGRTEVKRAIEAAGAKWRE